MPATLDIRETPEGLTFHVYQGRQLVRILLTLVFASVFGYLLYRSSDSTIMRIIFGLSVAFVVIRDVIGHLRGTDITLRVSNLDLISTGHAPDGYGPSSIPRASIYNLEFHKAIEGGEDAPQPSGLYVVHQGVLHDPVTCVLPHLDEAQTRQAIETILRRYPDTESLAPPKKGYASDLITLNLNNQG